MRKADCIAGLSVAGLILPEAVAYAGIAGLAPQQAIFAAIAGCLVYGLVGKSRFAIVTPTSSSAAILAACFLSVPDVAGGRALQVMLIVAFVGMLFLMASVFRLGNLASFVSRPVMYGFAFGLAVTIILRQLPTMAGVAISEAETLELAISLFSAMPLWHPYSVLVGVTAAVSLILLRPMPGIPGALLVLAGGILASRLLHLSDHGVALVGSIPVSLSWPVISVAHWRESLAIVPYTLPLALILFAESWGTIRSLSLRHGENVTANRELAALGLANIASAVVQGMPVGAGFSAGSASEAAGAGSKATAIVVALGLVFLVVFGADLIAVLPRPVLAAVVIASLTHALNPLPMLRLFRLRRDGFIALAAASGVLLFGVVNGVILATTLSLVALLRRLANPYVARLGQMPNGHDFVDMARHPDAKETPHVSIWRPAGPLFFANADAMLNRIASGISSDEEIAAVVISLEESIDLDSTALDVLLEFDKAMRAGGKHVQYARVHDRARDLIIAAEPSLAAFCNFSVDDAVTRAKLQLQNPDRVRTL